MTVAPQGPRKSVSGVILASLNHTGDRVVMDPKGENYVVTAPRRREMVEELYLFYPFGVTDDFRPDASTIFA